MGNVFSFDSDKYLNYDQISTILKNTHTLDAVASTILQKVSKDNYTTVNQMEDILVEIKLPKPKIAEILDEMREEYKRMKGGVKKTTPSVEIDMTDTSQVGQTPLLEQMIESIGVINTTLQELSASNVKRDEKQLKTDKILEKLLQEKKQQAETAKIIKAANITDPGQIEAVKKLIAPLDAKIEAQDTKIEKQNEKLDTFSSTFTTLVPKTTETIQSGTSCKEKAIKYIDERIKEKEDLLKKQERKAISYLDQQTNSKISLGIEKATLNNELKNDKFSKQIKEKYKIKTREEYEEQITKFSEQISECDSNISGMNESFRSFSNSVTSEIKNLQKEKQEVSDRYIMSEEEFQEIIRPIKEINLIGLGFRTAEVNQPTTSQQSIG